jgi:hypothetical protein
MAAEELKEIFGEDLLDKVGLLEEFKGLIGLLDLKPFECVGTVDEVRYALAMTAEKYASQNLKMPALLEYYVKEISRGTELEADLLKAYEKENAIPEEFLDFVAEMYEDVSKTD